VKKIPSSERLLATAQETGHFQILKANREKLITERTPVISKEFFTFESSTFQK